MMFILETLDGIRYVAQSPDIDEFAVSVMRPLFHSPLSVKSQPHAGEYRRYDKIGQDPDTGLSIFREAQAQFKLEHIQ